MTKSGFLVEVTFKNCSKIAALMRLDIYSQKVKSKLYYRTPSLTVSNRYFQAHVYLFSRFLYDLHATPAWKINHLTPSWILHLNKKKPWNALKFEACVNFTSDTCKNPLKCMQIHKFFRRFNLIFLLSSNNFS